MPSTSSLLRRLAALAWQFGPEAARDKRALLRAVGTRPLPTARQVRAWHDLLCLWHAYPDDAEVLAAVEGLLARFGDRSDVRRHREALENSGIAGTDLVYPFGAPTAQWLATTVPHALSIAWDRVEDQARVGRHLLRLAWAAEVPGYDEAPIEPVETWARRLAGPATDAAFVIRETGALEAGTLVRDSMYDELNLPIRVAAGEGSPRRTGVRWARAPRAFRSAPVDHSRPDLRAEARRAPLAVREVRGKDAARVIALAHEAMVTRERDLDAFASADPGDVRVVDWEQGLQFVCLGVRPERRFLLEAVYGFLTLQNGVPIGYALSSALFRSSEIAYNVFETFRGGEAAHVYARLLATVRTLFGSDTFAIYPYQLGHENDEGLHSGAWWFYYKLGFRPREVSIAPIVARELRRIAAGATYRTPPDTLKRLAAHPLFLSLGRQRSNVIGVMPLGTVGLAVSDVVAERFGANRAAAERQLTAEAAALLRVRSPDRWPAGERLFWRRWAPLVAVLPGLDGWSRRDRASLAAAIRAKGSAREADAVPILDAHAAFGRAMSRMMGRAAGRERARR